MKLRTLIGAGIGLAAAVGLLFVFSQFWTSRLLERASEPATTEGQKNVPEILWLFEPPEHGAIVINGDGSTLMNLGSLVTLANQPANVYLVIVDNGIYEVTGGQATAGSGHTDFAAMARGAGIKRVYAFDATAAWNAKAGEAFSEPGPVVIVLKVEARMGQKTPLSPRSMPEQIARLKEALTS